MIERRLLGRAPMLDPEQAEQLQEIQPYVLQAKETLGKVHALAEKWDRSPHLLLKYLAGRGPKRFFDPGANTPKKIGGHRAPILSDEQMSELRELHPFVKQAKAELRKVDALAASWDRPPHILRKYLRGFGPKRYPKLYDGSPRKVKR